MEVIGVYDGELCISYRLRSSSHKNLYDLYVIKNQVFHLLFMSCQSGSCELPQQ
jgi:hypothetical protein